MTWSAGMAQKLWKTKVATRVKPANTSAAQRVPNPAIKANPQPTSITMAIAAPAEGNGKPLDAMYPTVPAKPPILLRPAGKNKKANKRRPIKASGFWSEFNIGKVFRMGSGKIRKQGGDAPV